MPKLRLVQIESWSLSRYSTYDQCPYKAHLKINRKLKEPDGPAMVKGTTYHNHAEEYIKFPKSILAQELLRFEDEFKMLREKKATGEQSWGFTKDWEPCDSMDWNRCWLRVKLDAYYLEQASKNGKLKMLKTTTAHVIDYKTGREYEDHELQRSLYALATFLQFPDVEEVVAEHWYLEWGFDRKSTFKRKDVPRLKKEWLGRIKAMMNDTTFAPRPGPYCVWCHFRKANKGPCEY